MSLQTVSEWLSRLGRIGLMRGSKKSWARKFLLVTISSAKCTWPFCTDRTSQKKCAPSSPYYCSSSGSWALLQREGKGGEENCIYRTARKRILKQTVEASLALLIYPMLLKLKVIFTFYRLTLRRMHLYMQWWGAVKTPSLTFFSWEFLFSMQFSPCVLLHLTRQLSFLLFMKGCGLMMWYMSKPPVYMKTPVKF